MGRAWLVGEAALTRTVGYSPQQDGNPYPYDTADCGGDRSLPVQLIAAKWDQLDRSTGKPYDQSNDDRPFRKSRVLHEREFTGAAKRAMGPIARRQFRVWCLLARLGNLTGAL